MILEDFPEFLSKMINIIGADQYTKQRYQVLIKSALKKTGLPQKNHDIIFQGVATLPGGQKLINRDPIDLNRRLSSGSVDNELAILVHFALHLSGEWRPYAIILEDELVKLIGKSVNFTWRDAKPRRAAFEHHTLSSTIADSRSIIAELQNKRRQEDYVQDMLNEEADEATVLQRLTSEPNCTFPVFLKHSHFFHYVSDREGLRRNTIRLFNGSSASLIEEKFTLLGNIDVKNKDWLKVRTWVQGVEVSGVIKVVEVG
ncbi:MAG: hypothetical protein AAF092_10075 [Pseudomonadota bacterium]